LEFNQSEERKPSHV